MRVAIIGAGWAGLAAAVRLLRAGLDVCVYEAAALPGGRARPVDRAALGLRIDNGQHILLGAYHETFALMRELGVDPRAACQVMPLHLCATDGRLRLRFWPLPAPAHRLGILLGSRGLGGWQGRRHLMRVLGGLEEECITPQATVTQWLDGLGCPPRLLHDLWEPLCLAVTNTPADRAQARLFARVLRQGLAGPACDSQLYIPRDSLHALWPERACTLLGDRLRRQQVRRLDPDPSGGWRVDGQRWDQVVLATPALAAHRLLQPLPRSAEYLGRFPPPAESSIGTLTLRLQRPWQSGQAMSLLRDDPARGAWGQWLFDRSATARTPAARHLVHVVIGAADRCAGLAADQVAQGIIEQIGRQSRIPLPPVVARTLVTERRATFDAVPGLPRPGTATPWPGLWLAGDWTDTGYPAVLEGAVRSGLRAAGRLLAGA